MVALINTALMRTIMATSRLRQRFTEERGQDLMEYAILSGMIAVVAGGLFATAVFTGALSGMRDTIAACLTLDGACP